MYSMAESYRTSKRKKLGGEFPAATGQGRIERLVCKIESDVAGPAARQSLGWFRLPVAYRL